MTHSAAVANSNQADLRFLVEKNADGIIVLDTNGTVMFANPAAQEIFGRGCERLIGSSIGLPTIAGETTEIAVHRPDGEKVDVEIRVVETIWETRPALLVSLRDISERRAMEMRLRHSAKMEAVGRLTAGIAHDFNNLLTVVIGNLDLAQRSQGPRPARALDNAMRGAKRAAVLTERLLAFARRKPLEPRRLDVNTLVADMSDLLQRTLGEGINVKASLTPDLWPVEADQTELEAAILNLAVNARDAMPSGGTLTIDTRNAELDAAYAAAHPEVIPGFYVQIAVTDTGSGMTADIAAQAFEPFFTTKPDGLGTGLGLSHVYGFCKQSGGHVKIYSEPGIGTTVKIYLPRVTGIAERSVERLNEPDLPCPELLHRSSGETILIVEDDSDVREYTVTCLRNLGYRVLEASDGASALAIIDAEPALRLLVTDLGLPGGMDGRTIGERARRKYPGLKVLLMTAYAAAALVHDGRLDSGVELLAKPFTASSLCARVHELLQRDGQAPCILVVEDEPLVRMFIVDALIESGYQVEEAANAEAALAKFRGGHPKLQAAVIDVGLPDRSGEEVMKEMHALAPDFPIVLASGYSDSSLRKRYGRHQKLRIVGKPFQPSRLMEALTEIGIRVPQPSNSTSAKAPE